MAMKTHQLLCMTCAVLLITPLLAGAEVYKWKDKDGTIRYSDTPPLSNVKPEPIGKKKVAKPIESAPASDAKNPPAQQSTTKVPLDPDAEAAKVRQRNAEIDKKNKQEMEAQAKLNEENCKAAKANHQSYVQGGRVYKMNERGEREYLGDKELKEGAENTQAEIDEYCK